MTLRIAQADAALPTSRGRTVPFRKGDLVVHSIEGINRVWETSASSSGSGSGDDDDVFQEPSDPGFVDSLVFGSGAHKCPGKSYAIVALQTFVAAFCDELDAVRPGDRYDPHLMYYPTLFPTKSDFLFVATPRHSGRPPTATTAATGQPRPPVVVPEIKVGNVRLGVVH